MSATAPSSSPAQQSAVGRPKVWASGRTLNEAQRERKRQMDRVSKSKRRKDEQRLIDSLRVKVDELTAKVKVLEEQNAGPLPAPASAATAATSLSIRPNPANVLPANASQPVRPHATNGFVEELPDHVEPLVARPAAVVPLPHETTLATQANSTNLPPEQIASIEELITHLLGMALVVDPSTVCRDQNLNQDAIIRGILYGWDDVLAGPYVCPLWEVVGRFDRFIFGFTSVLTRFSTIKTIHNFLMVCWTDSFDLRDSS